MAIKFSAKEQPASTATTAKPARPATDVKKPTVAPRQADGSAETATDLFLSPAETPKGKARKKK